MALSLFIASRLQAQRMHDATKASLTHDASTKFDQLTGKDNSVYDLALKNVDTVHASDLDVLRQRNLATLNSELDLIPTLTWAGFMDRVNARRQKILAFVPSAPGNAVQDNSTRISELKKTIDALQKKLDAEKAATSEAAPTVKEIHSFINGAMQSGKIDNASLKTLQAKAQQIPDLLDKLKKIESGLVQMPSGLQPVILDSQLKQAQIEVDRLTLEQQHDTAVIQQYREQLATFSSFGTSNSPLACGREEDYGDFRFFLHYLCPQDHKTLCAGPPNAGANLFDAQPDDLVLANVQRLAIQARELTPCGIESSKSLQDLLNLLSLYASLAGVRTYIAEASDLSTANDELKFQIRLAQINAREHEALISSALKGLDTFEEGGVKPEDVANLIRAAETAATAVIAGRVAP
jgi:hypothetical protein